MLSEGTSEKVIVQLVGLGRNGVGVIVAVAGRTVDVRVVVEVVQVGSAVVDVGVGVPQGSE